MSTKSGNTESECLRSKRRTAEMRVSVFKISQPRYVRIPHPCDMFGQGPTSDGNYKQTWLRHAKR